ncbi:MAG: hypothetical protein LDLANPLL_01443 [Turneriella sp.]|nr:hypothetical protein [Turneriella sp.]
MQATCVKKISLKKKKLLAKMHSYAGIILVTGASQGLGFALAKKLNRLGYTTILNARNLSALKEAQKQLEFPENSFVFAYDVSSPLLESAWKKWAIKNNIPKLDAVVHSAGINHIGCVVDIRLKNAETTFRVNAFSIFTLAQATRGYLEKSDKPRFVLVSSLMQYFAMPNRSVYAASKSAAEIFAGAWRTELKKEKSHIRVQIFRPAGIETRFHENTKTDGKSARSNVSRMSAEKSADYLFKLLHSNCQEMAPGFMNKVAAFMARHFPKITQRFLN